jgi:hypothetical protein
MFSKLTKDLVEEMHQNLADSYVATASSTLAPEVDSIATVSTVSALAGWSQ